MCISCFQTVLEGQLLDFCFLYFDRSLNFSECKQCPFVRNSFLNHFTSVLEMLSLSILILNQWLRGREVTVLSLILFCLDWHGRLLPLSSGSCSCLCESVTKCRCFKSFTMLVLSDICFCDQRCISLTWHRAVMQYYICLRPYGIVKEQFSNEVVISMLTWGNKWDLKFLEHFGNSTIDLNWG